MTKHSRGKLLQFSQFLLNRKCFTSNSLLAIDIHYEKELLPRKFSCEHLFSILTVLPYMLLGPLIANVGKTFMVLLKYVLKLVGVYAKIAKTFLPQKFRFLR